VKGVEANAASRIVSTKTSRWGANGNWSELQRKSLNHKSAAGHLKNLCALVVHCDQLRCTDGYLIPAQSSSLSTSVEPQYRQLLGLFL
jgi:hypothetical protein